MAINLLDKTEVIPMPLLMRRGQLWPMVLARLRVPTTGDWTPGWPNRRPRHRACANGPTEPTEGASSSLAGSALGEVVMWQWKEPCWL